MPDSRLRWSHDNAELEIWLDYVNLHPYELLPREAIPLRTGGALPQRESSGLDVKGGALPRHESSALDVKGDKSFAVLDLNSSKSSALSSGNACGVSSLLKPISGSVEPKRTAAPKELKNGGNLFSFPLLWFTTAKQAVHLFVRAPIASRRMMEWHFKFRFVDLGMYTFRYTHRIRELGLLANPMPFPKNLSSCYIYLLILLLLLVLSSTTLNT